MEINREKQNELSVETVLVLQGGGSLGAYECGVYKTLTKHNIKFDIVSGTSIGALNAAIIAAHSYDSAKNSVQQLENFWLELAETLIPLPQQFSSAYFTDASRAILASMYSAIYGNPKAFLPVWITSGFFFNYLQPFRPFPYPLFDIAPLKKTLSRYVDFINLRNPNRPRLIVTSTDIQTSEPAIFDSKYVNIDADHVIASAGFPFYGIEWTQKDDRYLWDGALLSNTPLREVIDASPIMDKIVYLVNIFPHYQKDLPQDMFEAWHRAKDIIYTDKTDTNVRLSKIISRHLSLLKEMHDLLMTTINVKLKEKGDEMQPNAKLKERFDKMEREYNKLASKRGAIIKKIVRIERPEKTHFLFEDADFSVATIKKLIRQGEDDTERALTKNSNNQ
ncbi:MAG TPA: patatin-like phospholipase family protein [Nitrososphaeraceae archaeon]|nr:patatin-like phospholipase family protein [Nitrososphaeraceae archaeon]